MDWAHLLDEVRDKVECYLDLRVVQLRRADRAHNRVGDVQKDRQEDSLLARLVVL
jgi:hypothetical protein